MARLIRLRGTADAEFSLIVSDDYQGLGIGREMVRRLIDVARAEGVQRLVAEVLTCNSGMVRICSELGFTIHDEGGGDTLRAELRLNA